MNKITLRLTNDGWVADFGDDPEIKALFGCSIIPTPFTQFTAAETVLDEIRYRNPNHQVVLG